MLANILDKTKISLAFHPSLPERKYLSLQGDLNNIHIQFLWREHIGAGQTQCGCWVQNQYLHQGYFGVVVGLFPFPSICWISDANIHIKPGCSNLFN